jgi:RimJ/RimL family protein N-acetyltransferase
MIQIRRLNPSDWDWVQKRDPIKWVSDIGGLTAFDSDTGKITGIFVVYDVTINSCYCHFIIDNPMSLKKKHLETVFDFVFNKIGCKILLGHVLSTNTRSLRVLKKLGFKKHSWVVDGIEDGVHEVKVILKRENCKYLRKRGNHGK